MDECCVHATVYSGDWEDVGVGAKQAQSYGNRVSKAHVLVNYGGPNAKQRGNLQIRDKKKTSKRVEQNI